MARPTLLLLTACCLSLAAIGPVKGAAAEGSSSSKHDRGATTDAAPAATAASPVTCSAELDSYCPPNTTCCPKFRKKKKRMGLSAAASPKSKLAAAAESEREITGYSCLVSWSSRVLQGPCCDDDDHDEDSNDEGGGGEGEASPLGSGCAVGYSCAAPLPRSSSNSAPFLQGGDKLALGPHCARDDDPSEGLMYERAPRYRTCPAFGLEDINAPYGLSIPSTAAAYHDKSSNGEEDDGAKLNIAADESDLYLGQLAYFTNMGPLATTSSSPDSSSHADITTAVVGIHGSGRDASSYLCAMIAAVMVNEENKKSGGASSSKIVDSLEELGEDLASSRRLRSRDINTSSQSIKSEEGEVLVIAPWFLAPADGEVESAPTSPPSSSLPFLRWVDDAPVAHTFRYGAESIPHPENHDSRNKYKTSTAGAATTTTTISSYGAMDALLETLCDRTHYPKLERIVVVGHSAGGQFVHRWGLSSDSWCFGDSGGNGNVGEEEGKEEGVREALPSVRMVPANPRSYAYLDGRRYLPRTAGDADGAARAENNGAGGALSPFDELELRVPSESRGEDCREYNRYCWGLEENPDLPAPYIANAVDGLDRTDLFCRYASRDVVYLSGERDTAPLGNQICDQDGYQGPSRRERSERFFEALQVRGWEEVESGSGACGGIVVEDDEEGEVRVHDRLVVEDVGHDHALIFQSKEGRDGMFS